MKVRNFLTTDKFTRFVLAVWLACSAILGFLLYEIDLLINGELYNYGLQFNNAWSTSYSVLKSLICISIAVPLLLSVLALVSVNRKEPENEPLISLSNEENFSSKPQSREQVQVLINCPKCRKVFSKALAMFDFSNGKTKLVKVCPYCNNTLSIEEEAEQTIHVIQNEETVQANDYSSIENKPE